MLRKPKSPFKTVSLLTVLTIAVCINLSAQKGPEPGSPRSIGLENIAAILESTPDQLDAVLERVIAPEMWERSGRDGVRNGFIAFRQDLEGAELRGARPVDALSAEMIYRLDGDTATVRFSVESDPPHRLTTVSIDIGPGERSTGPQRAVAASDLPAAVEEYLEERAEAGDFSGTVILAKNGKPVVARALGKADRESGRALTFDTPINIGSMNKMFTGLAIGQLASQGKLDWNDTVGKHLPDYPNKTVRDKVTIHQLLTHTSGVPSYWNDKYEASKDEIQTLGELVLTFADEPLMFEPGSGNRYSNGGPVVLGLIIEKITGQSYYDYIREHIYGPAGMENTDHFLKTDKSSGVAIGYHREAPDTPFMPNTEILGLVGSSAGGGYASANDLLKFARALDSGKLLSKEWLEKLWTAQTGDDPEFGYGYLWGTGKERGKRWVGHNGGAPGVSADFRHFPEAGYTVIVLGTQSRAAMPVSSWIIDLITAG